MKTRVFTFRGYQTVDISEAYSTAFRMIHEIIVDGFPEDKQKAWFTDEEGVLIKINAN